MNTGVDEGETSPHNNSSILPSFHPKGLTALNLLDLSAYVFFKDSKVIGAGAFGDVSKAQYTLPGRAATVVAIKRIRSHVEDDLEFLIEKEIYIWAKLKHANILPLLGYVLDKSGYPLLVSEWMVNGSARDYTLKNEECDLLKLASGISKGLMYIHQMGIIHSDIKPENVVVSASGEACICDFGSSSMVTTAASHSSANANTKLQGTPHYLSYELVAVPNQDHTKESDVWAFGMTVFALLAHQHPYAQVPKEHVSAVIASRKLPTFPSSESSWTRPRLEARDVFWSVCQLCWDHNSSTRADIAIITSILRYPKMHVSIFEAHQLSKEGAMHECLHSLLAVLETISKAIDDVSAIHQNLNSVLKTVSTFAKNVSRSSKTDKKLIDLFQNILKAFEFADTGGTLSHSLRLLEKSIIYILQKTESSFDLVSEHIASGRLLDTLRSERLNEHTHTLLECKKACDSILSYHEAAVRTRKSEEINIKLLRELLAPSDSYGYDRPTCLENTRVGVRREIIDWVDSKTSPNVLWLYGVAGSGKSTISRTIAEYFDSISQLGAFIFFEREKSDPSSVIPAIAFKLAEFDSSIGSRIVDQVKKDKDILSAKPALQFSDLLLQPISASSTAIREPVVIILDALDECGVPQKRRDLIQVLRNELPKLPLSFRILITSRQETDIVKALTLDPSTVSSIELDCTSTTSQSDVLHYIKVEMRNLVTNGMAVPEDWSWDVNMVLLGNAASGLFVWASTAVRLIATSSNPFSTLEGLIKDTRSLNRFGLDELYATVLRGSGISWESETSRTRFSRVIGLVIFGKAPFTIDAMDAFLGFSRVSSSRLVLTKIRCLISFTISTPIRLFHVSFVDYLTSPERSKDPWSIDISSERSFQVMQCFTIMRRELHFNICSLSTSFFPNDIVAGLPDRVREKISVQLGYVCRFWAQHLHDVPFSAELVKQLASFAYERLLYWFEVLSLTKHFYGQAVQALRDANEWTGDQEPELSLFLVQAIKLASTFAVPISESTPHIYVSMLLLAEQQSVVSACYTKLASSLVTVDRRGAFTTSLLKLLEGHTDRITEVGFSPDGKRIVSGSQDKTVRVWEAESGLVVALFQGHNEGVTSVGFSPDGKRVVSGSYDRMVYIWEAESGKLVAGPFEGHTNGVTSVEFSHDGKRVVSGSYDSTVRMWEVESGCLAASPFHGHTSVVTSVRFSPNGKLVVSGSWDKTVRIWEAKSGQLIVRPFEGHIDRVTSVRFSPDGKRVVSSSEDNTVRVWEVESGSLAVAPFEGHTGHVTSVGFSPDGKRIVSGSEDNTVCVWEAESGNLIAGPFQGHTKGVSSVWFSPDGKRVVSGSQDNTVRVWEVESTVHVAIPSEGHTEGVTSVGFSPDGKRVVSGSSDKTIRVWKIESGNLVAGPFRGHSSIVTSVEFSPDGRRIVSGSYDKTVRVWEVESGKLVAAPFEGHADEVTSVGFSPDGTLVVSGSEDNTIRIWEAENGNNIAGPFEGHGDRIISVGFSPDGKHVVSGSEDTTVCLWEVESGNLVINPLQGHASRVTSVGFSPDGRSIVSGSWDKTIRIWEAKRGNLIAGPFEGHTKGVTSVRFSPDGKRIVSSSWDKTIRVWEVESGRLVAGPFEGHTKGVTSVGFSPDGKRVVTGSADKTIRVWDIEIGEELSSTFAIPTNILASRALSQCGKHIIPISPNRNFRSSDVDTVDGLLNSSGEVSNWVMSDDYWVRSKEGKLLLWIPPVIRPTLWRANNAAVLSCQFSTRLDFKNCTLGQVWYK